MVNVSSLRKPSDVMIGRILDGMFKRTLEYDKSGLLVFHAARNPEVIYDNFSDVVEREYLECFIQSSYARHPVFQAFLNGDMPPVATARKLAARSPIHKEPSYLLSSHTSLTPSAISDEAYISVTKGSLFICYVAMDLSHFRAAPIAHLCSLCFEGQGAFPAEC